MAFENVYVQLADGARYGPATYAELRRWVAARQVPRNCTILDADTNEQRPLHTFPDLVILMPTDITDVLMPRNAPAVVGYYVGVFSFAGLVLCVPGLIMGVAAIALGVLGLRKARENPLARGRGHAITAIVLGTIVSLLAVLGIAGLIGGWFR